MNRKLNIITTKILNRSLALCVSVSLFLFAATVFAHGGFDHVNGTVVKVANNMLTVKTAKGNVDVMLDAKTEITKNDKKAEVADLKAGVRVVVDVPEGNEKMKMAHSVKIGVATAAKADAHSHDDHDDHDHDAHK